MSHKHRKIEIATPDDVAKYSNREPSEPPADPTPDAAGSSEGASSPDAAGNVPAGAPSSPGSDALRAELEQWKDKCLRARAELANYQRRANQERAEAIKYANAAFARALLPVVDDLERALSHVGTVSADGDAVVHALKLIHDNLVKVLKEYNVEPIEAAGLPFDPASHHALMQRPSDEYAEPTVLEVLQKGYRLHERVLRPAQVVVSKSSSEAAPGGADSQPDEKGPSAGPGSGATGSRE